MQNKNFDDAAALISNKIIDVPKDMDLRELRAWMLGYSRCQDDDLKILNGLKKERGDV